MDRTIFLLFEVYNSKTDLINFYYASLGLQTTQTALHNQGLSLSDILYTERPFVEAQPGRRQGYSYGISKRFQTG